MSAPNQLLEQRAADQRRQLHHSVQELRSAVRERLDVNAYAREYWPAASAGMAVLGLLLGYALASVFSRD